jgi:hypothetical protein
MKSRFPFRAGFLPERGPEGHGSEDGSGRAEAGPAPKKPLLLALRYVFGMAGLGFLYIALKRLLPVEDSPYYALARFCLYGAAGFWVSAVAPAFFVRFSLARSG